MNLVACTYSPYAGLFLFTVMEEKKICELSIDELQEFVSNSYVIKTIKEYEALGFIQHGTNGHYSTHIVMFIWGLMTDLPMPYQDEEICSFYFVMEKPSSFVCRLRSEYWHLVKDELEYYGGVTSEVIKELKIRANDYVLKEKKERKSKPNKKKERPRNLYLVVDSEHKKLKIGISGNVKERVSQLNTANPYDIKLLYTIPNKALKDEEAIHQKFNHLNVNREWFDYSEEIVEYFKSMQDEIQ